MSIPPTDEEQEKSDDTVLSTPSDCDPSSQTEQERDAIPGGTWEFPAIDVPSLLVSDEELGSISTPVSSAILSSFTGQEHINVTRVESQVIISQRPQAHAAIGAEVELRASSVTSADLGISLQHAESFSAEGVQGEPSFTFPESETWNILEALASSAEISSVLPIPSEEAPLSFWPENVSSLDAPERSTITAIETEDFFQTVDPPIVSDIQAILSGRPSQAFRLEAEGGHDVTSEEFTVRKVKVKSTSESEPATSLHSDSDREKSEKVTTGKQSKSPVTVPKGVLYAQTAAPVTCASSGMATSESVSLQSLSTLSTQTTVTYSQSSTTRKEGRKSKITSKKRKASSQDEMKKERRRERNKFAAQRCRQRKKDQTESLLKEYKELQSSHTRLQYEINKLRKQKKEYSGTLETHRSKGHDCKLKKKKKPTSTITSAQATISPPPPPQSETHLHGQTISTCTPSTISQLSLAVTSHVFPTSTISSRQLESLRSQGGEVFGGQIRQQEGTQGPIETSQENIAQGQIQPDTEGQGQLISFTHQRQSSPSPSPSPGGNIPVFLLDTSSDSDE